MAIKQPAQNQEVEDTPVVSLRTTSRRLLFMEALLEGIMTQWTEARCFKSTSILPRIWTKSCTTLGKTRKKMILTTKPLRMKEHWLEFQDCLQGHDCWISSGEKNGNNDFGNARKQRNKGHERRRQESQEYKMKIDLPN